MKFNFETFGSQPEAQQEGFGFDTFGQMAKSQPKPDLLQRATTIAGKIFPGQKVGESIGTLGGLGLTKAKESLGLVPKGTTAQFDTTAPSPLKVAADVAGGALNVGLMQGAGTVGTFGQRLLKMAGIGGGLSGTQAIKDGGDVGDVAKSTAIGAGIGAAMPVVGAGLSSLGRQIEQLPARFINSALGRSKAQVLKDISRDKVDDLANYVVNNKSALKTADTHFRESADAIETLSKKITSSLAQTVTKSGSKSTIGRDNLLDSIAKLPEAEGALLKRTDIKSIIERLAPQSKKLLQKPSLTITESNQLRQLVDKTLGDRAFLGGQLSSDKLILKKFADTLREQVKEKAPQGTRALFSELSNEIQFRDAILGKIAQKQGNQVLSFGDFIGGGLGGIFGGGIGGAVAGVATRRAIESVPFKLSAAKLTNALTKLEPIIEQTTPAVQTAILEFFADVLSEEESNLED